MSRLDTYNTIVEAGFNIGAFEEFDEAMDDERRIKKLWEKINKEAKLGSLDDFKKSVVKKKDGSAAAESYYGVSGEDEAQDQPGYDIYQERMANYEKKQQELGKEGAQGYYQTAEGMQFLGEQEQLLEQEEALGFKTASSCPIGMVWDASRQRCVDADWWYENLSTEDQEKNSEIYLSSINDNGTGELDQYRDQRDLYLGRRELRKTPFKTQKEGQEFRKWVVDNYPEWAKTNNLTATGKEGYDNSYARKAYEVFGNYYNARLKEGEIYRGKDANYIWEGKDTGMSSETFYEWALGKFGPYIHDGKNTGMSEQEWKDKQDPGSQQNIKRKLSYLPWNQVVERFMPEQKDLGRFSKQIPTSKGYSLDYYKGGYEDMLHQMYNQRHAQDFENKLGEQVWEQLDWKINEYISKNPIGEYVEDKTKKVTNPDFDPNMPESGSNPKMISELVEKKYYKDSPTSYTSLINELKDAYAARHPKYFGDKANQLVSVGGETKPAWSLSKEGRERHAELDALINEAEHYIRWKTNNYTNYMAYKQEQQTLKNLALELQTKEGVDQAISRGGEVERNLTETAYKQEYSPEYPNYVKTYRAKVKDLYGKVDSYDKAYSILNDNISRYGSVYMSSSQLGKRSMLKSIENAIEAGAPEGEIALLRENYNMAFGSIKGKTIYDPFTGKSINEQELLEMPKHKRDYIDKIKFKTEAQSEALKKSMHFNPTGNIQQDLKDKRMRAYYTLIEEAKMMSKSFHSEGNVKNLMDVMSGFDEGWDALSKLMTSDGNFNWETITTASWDTSEQSISTKLKPLGYHPEAWSVLGMEVSDKNSKLQSERIRRFNEALSDFIALNNVLDLNLDPGKMERTGGFDRGVASFVDYFEPEGYDSFTLADEFVKDAVSNVKEMGYEVTPEQKERLELRFVDKLGDAVGGSIPVMMEIMAVSYFTGGMGLTSAAGKVGAVQKIFNATFGNNRVASLFGSMAEQGLIFSLTSEDFSTGVGEGAGFALYDMSGIDNLIKKSPMGRVVNTILKAMSGGTAETLQEYAGEFVNRLSSNETVGEAFRETFISDDPLEKLALTYTMSTMFGAASLRGDWKQTKLDMEEAILKAKSDSELVKEVQASIIKERSRVKKDNDDNLINTPDDQLTEDEVKEKNEVVNDRQIEKEEFVKELPPELKQELGQGVNLKIEPNPDGGLLEYDDAFETTYEINGEVVTEEEILSNLSDPAFLSDMANPDTETSVKINNGSNEVNEALDVAISSMPELNPVISKGQEAQQNAILADVEGSEPGVDTKEISDVAVDSEGELVEAEGEKAPAPKLSKGEPGKKKYSKDHTPKEEDYDLSTNEGRAVAVDDILDDMNNDLADLELGSTEKTNTKEDDALLDEFNEIEKSVSSDVFIDNSTGEKIIYNDPDSDAFNDIEFFDDGNENRNILDDIGLASPKGTTPTLSKEQETAIKNAPFYGKTLIKPLIGQDGSVIIPAGTKIGLKEAQQLIVENKKDFESSSQMDLISQVAYSNNPNIVKDVSETKKEDIERLIDLRDRIKSREKVTGKTSAKKVAPFKSTSEEALSKIDSKKISSEDAATEWTQQIIKKGEKGTAQELEQMGVIEPVESIETEEYNQVLNDIREYKKNIPSTELSKKEQSKWEEGLDILEKRRDELKKKLPKNKYVATEKFKKAVTKDGSPNVINKSDVEKFLKDNRISVEETTTEPTPKGKKISTDDINNGVVKHFSPFMGNSDIVTVQDVDGNIHDVSLIHADNIIEAGENISITDSKWEEAFSDPSVKKELQEELMMQGESLILSDADESSIFMHNTVLGFEALIDSLLEKGDQRDAVEKSLKENEKLYDAIREEYDAAKQRNATESEIDAIEKKDFDRGSKRSDLLTKLSILDKEIDLGNNTLSIIKAFDILGIENRKDYDQFVKTVAINKYNNEIEKGKLPPGVDTRVPYQKAKDHEGHSIPGGKNYQIYVLYTPATTEVSEKAKEESKISKEDQEIVDQKRAENKVTQEKLSVADQKANTLRTEAFQKMKEDVFLDPEVVSELKNIIFNDLSTEQLNLSLATTELTPTLGVGETELNQENFDDAYVTLINRALKLDSGQPAWTTNNHVERAHNQASGHLLFNAAIIIKNAINHKKGKPFSVIHTAEGDVFTGMDNIQNALGQTPLEIKTYGLIGNDGSIIKSVETEEELSDAMGDYMEEGFEFPAPIETSIAGLTQMLWANKNSKNKERNRELVEAQTAASFLNLESISQVETIRRLEGTSKLVKEKIERAQKEETSHDFFGENVNTVSWARTKDIETEIDGKKEKVMMINELQSDWAQKSRTGGVVTKVLSESEHDALLAELDAVKEKIDKKIENDPVIKKLDKDFYIEMGDTPNTLTHVKDIKPAGYLSNEQEIALSLYEVRKNQRLAEIKKENRGLAEKHLKITNQLSTESAKGTNSGMPNMPFKDTQTWTALQLRRLLKAAVSRGYDRIALPRGEQSGLAAGAFGASMRGNQKYYSGIVPNVLKKEARRLDKKAKLEEINLASDSGHPSKMSMEELNSSQVTGSALIKVNNEIEYRKEAELVSNIKKKINNARNNKKTKPNEVTLKGQTGSSETLVDANYSKAEQQQIINRLEKELKKREALRDEAAVAARGQEVNEQLTLKITPKMKEALADPSPTETTKLPKFSKGAKKEYKPTINDIKSTNDAIQKQETEGGVLRPGQPKVGLQKVGQGGKGTKAGGVSVPSKVEKPTIVTKNDSGQLDADIKAEKNPEKKKVLQNIKKVNTALGKVDSEMKIVVHKSEDSYSSAYEGAGGVKGDAMGTRGFFNNGKEIHINLNEATSETAFHEGAHKVIAAVLVNNPELLNKFNKQLRSILPANLVKKYDKKVESYDKAEQTEEFIVNILADVADGTLDLNTLPKTALAKLVDLFNKLLAKFGFDPRFTVSNLGDVVEFAEKMKNAFSEGVELDVSALTQETVKEVKDIPDKLKQPPKESKGKETHKQKKERILSKFNKAKKWMEEAKGKKKPKGELELLTNEEIKFAKKHGLITDTDTNNLKKEIDDYLDQAPPGEKGRRAGGLFGGRKARKFHERVSKASWVPNKVKNILEKAFYEPITNEELREFSKGVVDNIEHKNINEGNHTQLTIGDKFQAELEQLKSDPLIEEAMLVAIAMEMVDRLNNIATTTNSDAVAKQEANIVDFISERGTKMGQAIQAFKIFGSSSKHGLMSYAKKQLVDKGGLTEEQFEKERAELDRLINRIKDAPEGFQKANATFDFMSKIAKTNGIKKWKVAMAIWYANILSGYTTQGVNFVSTLLNGMLNLGSILAYRPMMVPRYLTHLFQGAVKPLTGIKRGITEFRSILTTGSKKQDKFDMPNELEMKEFKGIFKIFSKHKFVGRFMQATDAFFYETFKEQKAYMIAVDLAKEKGLKGRALMEEVSNIMYGTKETQNKIHEQAAKELNIELDKKGNPKSMTRKRAEEIAREEGYGISREQAEEIARERGYDNQPLEVDGEIKPVTPAMEKAFNEEVESLLKNRGEKAFKERARKIESRSTKLQYKRRVMELLEKNRPEGFAEDVHNFASTGTYNYKPKGALGHLAEGIGQITRKVPGLRFVFPFTRIVANVTNEALEYTPYGFKRAVFGMSGEKSSNEARAQHFTKALFGTALMIGFAMKAWDEDEEDFDITGAGPKDRQKYYDLLATGWRPYSIKIGNTYISYKYTPLNITLGAIGTHRDRVIYEGDEEGGWSLTQSLLFNTGANIMDQSFLSSGAQLMEAIGRGEDATKQLIGSIARPAKSFVIPNLYAQIERAADPTLYEAKTIPEYLMSQTPAIIHKHYLRPALNIFGEPIQRSVNPFFHIKDDSIDEEFKFLVDNKYWLSVPNNVQWYNGETTEKVTGFTEMTDEQRYQWVKDHGPKVKKYVNEWMNRSKEDIQKLKDNGVDIHKEIKRGVTKIREQSKTAMEWEDAFGEEYVNIEEKALTYLNSNDVYYDRPDRMKEIVTPDGEKRIMTTEEYEQYWDKTHTMSKRYIHEWFKDNNPEEFKKNTGEEAHEYLRTRLNKIEGYYQSQEEMKSVLGIYDSETNPKGYIGINDMITNDDGTPFLWEHYYTNNKGKEELSLLNTEEFLMINDVFLDNPSNGRKWQLSDYIEPSNYNLRDQKVALSPEYYKIYLEYYQESIKALREEMSDTRSYVDDDSSFFDEWSFDKKYQWEKNFLQDFKEEYLYDVNPKEWSNIP